MRLSSSVTQEREAREIKEPAQSPLTNRDGSLGSLSVLGVVSIESSMNECEMKCLI